MSVGKEKINVLSLFDGISCGQIALERQGIKVDNYFASEIDKDAIKITMANYPKTKQLGSVVGLKTDSLPKIDLLIGGSPCQSFSSVGNGSGFDGKSGLFWEYVRILKEVKPKYFLLENVSMKKEWEDIISDALGVKPIKINSKLLSAQNRPRLYWTNISNVIEPKDKGITIEYKDEWFNEIDTVPFVKTKLKNWETMGCFFNPYNKAILKDKTPTLTATGNRQTTSASIMFNDNGVLKMANSKYWEVLQTLPNDYTKGYSENIRKNAIGNGWTVDTVAFIFSFLKGENFNNFEI
jgi:site-specific DNA-cytosine methylase